MLIYSSSNTSLSNCYRVNARISVSSNAESRQCPPLLGECFTEQSNYFLVLQLQTQQTHNLVTIHQNTAQLTSRIFLSIRCFARFAPGFVSLLHCSTEDHDCYRITQMFVLCHSISFKIRANTKSFSP